MFYDKTNIVYVNAPFCPDLKDNDSSYGSEDQIFPPDLPVVSA